MNAAPRLARMTRSTRLNRLARLGVALLAGAAVALPALAQWAWRDSSGRTVYSDQPPPPTVKQDQILRKPAGNVLSTATPPSPAPAQPGATGAPGAPPAATGPKTIAEREQEFRKRQQERAEAEKKQAEEQAQNARKAQDCARARGYLRQLEDGVRIARTDAQGNREILDDSQRNAEMARAREVIAATCN